MKIQKQKPQGKPQQKKYSDNYEVASMMRRMSPYRNHRHSSQYINTGTIDTPRNRTRTISNTDGYGKETTGTASLEFMRLEDQLSDYNTRNESAHESLRNDFEKKINNLLSKIDDKLPTSLFKWIIGGLVTAVLLIVTGWINYSYDPLIKNVEKTSEDVRCTDKRVDQIDIKIVHIQNDLDELKVSKDKKN